MTYNNERIAIERVVAASLAVASGQFYRESSTPGPWDDAQSELEYDLLIQALHNWKETAE